MQSLLVHCHGIPRWFMQQHKQEDFLPFKNHPRFNELLENIYNLLMLVLLRLIVNKPRSRSNHPLYLILSVLLLLLTCQWRAHLVNKRSWSNVKDDAMMNISKLILCYNYICWRLPLHFEGAPAKVRPKWSSL